MTLEMTYILSVLLASILILIPFSTLYACFGIKDKEQPLRNNYWLLITKRGILENAKENIELAHCLSLLMVFSLILVSLNKNNSKLKAWCSLKIWYGLRNHNNAFCVWHGEVINVKKKACSIAPEKIVKQISGKIKH
jgi:hypothetical protein